MGFTKADTGEWTDAHLAACKALGVAPNCHPSILALPVQQPSAAALAACAAREAELAQTRADAARREIDAKVASDAEAARVEAAKLEVTPSVVTDSKVS
jgi:hypothetical protein